MKFFCIAFIGIAVIQSVLLQTGGQPTNNGPSASNGHFGQAKQHLYKGLENAGGFTGNTVQVVHHTVRGAGASAVNRAKGVADGVRSTRRGVANGIESFAGGFKNSFGGQQQTGGQPSNNGPSASNGHFEQAKQHLNTGLENAGGFTGNTVQVAHHTVQGAGASAVNRANGVAKGVADGVRDTRRGVANGVESFAGGFINSFGR
ncbi:uncharacterized protein LOC129577996 [Sitodiplosis mosellana]|uniref:uncharacterized protein LOC129577996 n=1 Tax=Sitodiplosis mosellana TaxID=263140 RepID=UPI002444FFE6|nr:uncharacterized protein LOC129577996 [Sitodiplosis mosellana]